ncbi:hypothetical protein O3G_MSEX000816, partial [Manduca sexta]
IIFVSQRYDMYRRRQRLFVEMEQMASRPSARCASNSRREEAAWACRRRWRWSRARAGARPCCRCWCGCPRAARGARRRWAGWPWPPRSSRSATTRTTTTPPTSARATTDTAHTAHTATRSPHLRNYTALRRIQHQCTYIAYVINKCCT